MFISHTIFLCILHYISFFICQNLKFTYPSFYYISSGRISALDVFYHISALSVLPEQQCTTTDSCQAELTKQVNIINSWAPTSNWSLRLLRIPRFLWQVHSNSPWCFESWLFFSKFWPMSNTCPNTNLTEETNATKQK